MVFHHFYKGYLMRGYFKTMPISHSSQHLFGQRYVVPVRWQSSSVWMVSSWLRLPISALDQSLERARKTSELRLEQILRWVQMLGSQTLEGQALLQAVLGARLLAASLWTRTLSEI